MFLRRISIALVLALSSSGCADLALEGELLPARLAVYTDTDTTAAGRVEIEAGLVLDPGAQLEVPAAIKFGVDDSTELFATASPVRRVHVDGPDVRGLGDVGLSVRRRFREARDWSLAFEAGALLPAEDDGAGRAELGFTGALIAAASPRPGVGLVGSYRLDLVGEGRRDFDAEHSLSAVLQLAVARRGTLFAELSGAWAPEPNDWSTAALLGFAFLVSDSVQLDVGVATPLSGDESGASARIGLTGILPWPTGS